VPACTTWCFPVSTAEGKIPAVSEPTPLFTTHVAAEAPEVLAAIKDAAEDWGATWKPSDDGAAAEGTLHLPVIAGLRRGFQEGRVTVEGAADGAGRAVRFQVERQSYRLWKPAIALLLVAAWGGIVSVLWPFWPRLLQYVPIGLVLAFSAWFLIVPRLRNEGADDFLNMVGAYADGEPEPAPEPPEDGAGLSGTVPGELPGRWNGEVR